MSEYFYSCQLLLNAKLNFLLGEWQATQALLKWKICLLYNGETDKIN